MNVTTACLPHTSVGNLHLVSCVSKKRLLASRAKDLYVSDWFKKAKGHMEAVGEEWFVLSAEYGLVHPEQVVEPYERTLNKMAKAERQQWAERVLLELNPVIKNKSHIVFWAGQRYREFLIEPLMNSGVSIEVPLEGLKIGEQLQWFKNQ